MADTHATGPAAPTTAEGFLADRLNFWHAVTRFGTWGAVAIVILLLLMWYFLV